MKSFKLIVIFLSICLVACSTKRDTQSNLKPELAYLKYVQDSEDEVTFEETADYKTRLEHFNSLSISDDDIVMIGDSNTQRIEWSEIYHNANVKNRGINSDRIQGVLNRIDSIIAHTPAAIILNIGINNLHDRTRNDIILDKYRQLLNQIKDKSPTTQIHVIAVYPVNNTKYNNTINNENIVAFNLELRGLCNELLIDYYDISEILLLNGELNEKFTFDGVHPNGLGISVISEQIGKKYNLFK